MTEVAGRCTVERACSSTGRRCPAEDRGCQGDAVAAGLEVTCEQVSPRAFVYCPPGGQQRDSNVVWILLAVALAIAAFGGAVGYAVLRKKVER